MSPSSRTDPPGWLLPLGLGVIVVILVVIALARGPASFDPDTAEGTVQEYLLAIDEGRWDDAVEIVHEDWRGNCSGTDLESFGPGEFTAELGNETGFDDVARFGEVPEDGIPAIPEDATEVEVTINHRTGAGLGSGWSEVATFDLVDDGELWWLVGDPWPHFVWSCQGGL